MRILSAKCKICGCELRLECDESYDELSDAQHLVPKATCNECYDLRCEGLRLYRAVRGLIYKLAQMEREKEPERKAAERCRDLSTKLCERIANWQMRFKSRQPDLRLVFQPRDEVGRYLYGYIVDWTRALERCHDSFNAICAGRP